jgi:hypothetical protein
VVLATVSHQTMEGLDLQLQGLAARLGRCVYVWGGLSLLSVFEPHLSMSTGPSPEPDGSLQEWWCPAVTLRDKPLESGHWP